jgi:hypothetical protein
VEVAIGALRRRLEGGRAWVRWGQIVLLEKSMMNAEGTTSMMNAE